MKNLLFQIKTASEDFRRNKVRTFLASLGIMIGVLSVVMLIALGLGLKNYIKQQFESMGSNLIFIMPGSFLSGEGGLRSMGPGLMGGAKFDERDLTSLQRIPELDYVIPMYTKATLVEAKGEEEYGNILGTNEEAFKALNLEPKKGIVFTKSDVQRKAKKVVLGYNLAKDLFGEPEDAIDKKIRFDNQRFKVIGILEKKGDQEMDAGIFMPYKTTFGSINPDKTFFAIYLGVHSDEDVDRVKNKAEEILLKRHEEEDFSVTEQTEMLNIVNQIFGVINGVLIAIGSISLVVGGIGIMNIMYANVSERTREVGIRRAIGATKKDILFQFLFESIMLSLFGGIMGLVIAIILVIIIRNFFPVAINLVAGIVAFGVSTFIGVFFGVFPARRAANLEPIEAIRYE